MAENVKNDKKSLKQREILTEIKKSGKIQP